MLKKKKSFSQQSISAALADGYTSPTYAPPKDPQVAPAAITAIQTGANPSILDQAKKYLGNKDFIGLCEAWVEQATGAPRKFASAIDDWNKTTDKIQGLNGVQAGNKVYFAPDKSNQGYGHVGLLDEKGNLLSSTNSGVQSIPLDQWIASTGQKVLGYSKT